MLKAKVAKKKRKDMTATQSPMAMGATAREQKFTPPTLAQQVQMREMVTARQADMSAGLTANAGSGPMRANRDADIYDERIGGYGKSKGPQESGEAAVQRIMKSKVKKKKK